MFIIIKRSKASALMDQKLFTASQQPAIHETLLLAEAEAKRLALENQQHQFFVMKAIAVAETPSPVVSVRAL